MRKRTSSYGESTSSKSFNKALVALIGCLILAIVWFLWADLYAGKLVVFLQQNLYWLTWLGVFGLGCLLFVASKKTLLIGALVSVVGVAGTIYVLSVHSYRVDRQYVEALEQTEEATPTFEERAAYTSANQQAAGNLGSVYGTPVATKYIADKGVYNSLVQAPGKFGVQGYSGVQEQKLDLTGQSLATTCKLTSNADRRLGGTFNHSLERAIAHEKRNLIISKEDAYGYCDENGTAQVVVPVKELKGFWHAIVVPAGVFTYDGKTGDLKYHRTVKAGEIPGPVFPLSVARELREAASATGTWWQYAISHNSGFGDTSDDQADPNAGNRSEFALSEDGTPTFVTPLTRRASKPAKPAGEDAPSAGKAIVALGVLDASNVKAGSLNTFTVHTFPEDATRKSNSAVEDNIRATYGSDIAWASGADVFEVVPVNATEWVASIGLKQNVTHRVRIKANGESCLETAKGDKVHCSSEGTSDQPSTPGATGNLQGLSDQEIVNLQRQLADELERRLATK